MMKKLILFTFGALLATSALAAPANFCGELKGRHYGPFDYRRPTTFNIDIVEQAHFTPEVAAGIKGSTGYLGGDLSYTLMVIPNHVPALTTMARVGIRDKSLKLLGAKFPVECYFDRAMRFTPDDSGVHAAYGLYLSSLGRTDDALKAFRTAVDLAPEDPTINYNVGLIYLKNKDYDKALFHAKKAYGKDFPLPGLKNKLVAAGKWVETEAPAQ